MNDKEYFELLQKTCLTDDIDTFKNNIENLSNIEYSNENGWTLLIIAAFEHSYKIVQELVTKGANINAANYKGTTVLMYAKTKVKQNENFAFLDYLIENGADVTAKDNAGKNVLDYVIETGDELLIHYFKKKLRDTVYGK